MESQPPGMNVPWSLNRHMVGCWEVDSGVCSTRVAALDDSHSSTHVILCHTATIVNAAVCALLQRHRFAERRHWSGWRLDKDVHNSGLTTFKDSNQNFRNKSTAGGWCWLVWQPSPVNLVDEAKSASCHLVVLTRTYLDVEVAHSAEQHGCRCEKL